MLLQQVETFRQEVLAHGDASLMLPAGCGKTEILAALASASSQDGLRVLVLTHTNAGATAMRRRLRKFHSAQGLRVRVATIDGMLQRLVHAYPTLGTALTVNEGDAGYWPLMRSSAVEIAGRVNVRAILHGSYDLIIVDEYQDCSVVQHEFVLKLADGIRTVVLGDPLQAIFGFDGTLVDWDEVVDRFPLHETLFEVYPWRWHGKNEALGEWLLHDLRSALSAGNPIDLTDAPVTWTPLSEESRRTVHYPYLASSESTVFILPAKHHVGPFAQKRKGRFPMMETRQMDEAQKLVRRLDESSTGAALAVAVFDVIESTTAGAPGVLKSTTATIRKRLSEGRALPSTGDGPTKLMRAMLNRVLAEASTDAVVDALEGALSGLGLSVYARDRLRSVKTAATIVDGGRATTYDEALAVIRSKQKRAGAPAPTQCSAHTLLIKGLEFERCVVVDGNAYSVENLYVALTRGAQQLEVVSTSPILQPG